MSSYASYVLSYGKYGSNFKNVILKHILQIKVVSNSCEIALRKMNQNTYDGKSTLVPEPMLNQIYVAI